MFCQKCGSPVAEGSRFCMQCGKPVGTEEPVSYHPTAASEGIPTHTDTQSQYSSGYVAPPYPPYGAYVAPPAKKRMSRKGKGLMWSGVGLAAALAIAAILVFVVFGAGMGLLSGNTVQTRFVNEGARVFAKAFSDFDLGNMPDIGTQPFDMEITAEMQGSESDTDMSVSMAYDTQTLGMLVKSADSDDVRLLLLEDTLYVEMFGMTTGMRIDTDADLSEPMTLKDRLSALAGNDKEDVDYKKLAEAFVNSIGEECFEKKNDSFTLELTAKDMQDTLNTFQDKLNEDDKLKNELEELIENNGSANTDIDEALDQAIASLDYVDFDINIKIVYANGKPSQIKVAYEDDTAQTAVFFGSKRQGQSRLINFSMEADGGYSEVEADMLVTKVNGGLVLSGSVDSGMGDTAEYECSLNQSGDTLSGTLDVYGSGTGEDSSVSFERVLTVGMPDSAVEEDRRFKMDTANAEVADIDDALSSLLPFWMMGSGFSM